MICSAIACHITYPRISSNLKRFDLATLTCMGLFRIYLRQRLSPCLFEPPLFAQNCRPWRILGMPPSYPQSERSADYVERWDRDLN